MDFCGIDPSLHCPVRARIDTNRRARKMAFKKTNGTARNTLAQVLKEETLDQPVVVIKLSIGQLLAGRAFLNLALAALAYPDLAEALPVCWQKRILVSACSDGAIQFLV